jgi:transposase
MIDVTAVQVWLAPGFTDMRRSIDGLAMLAQTVVGRNPLDDHLFVFCGRDRKRLKILYWQQNGFWLFYRRLESGRFRWPDAQVFDGKAVCVSRRQLAWLLDGLAIEQPRAHKAVGYEFVC